VPYIGLEARKLKSLFYRIVEPSNYLNDITSFDRRQILAAVLHTEAVFAGTGGGQGKGFRFQVFRLRRTAGQNNGRFDQ